ncbi:MAG: beta-1,3-glucanase family protein [Pseudomonadota bacterium]
MATTTFTIANESGGDLYVYDFNYSTQSAVTPLGGGALENKKTLTLTLQSDAERRIYFSAQRLSESLETGKAPDPFNYTEDASVMFSFAEYRYEPGNNRYTFDLSYIDVFSYPVTVQFSNLGTYAGAVANHVYGPTSLSEVKTQLSNHKDYAWSALVWPLKNVKTKWNHFPDGIYRVIGPNTAWQQDLPDHKTGPWVPTSYEAFFSSLPKTGTELFGSQSNWDGWQSLTQSAAPGPSDTGYVKALHAAATPDANGKYGFFCYPRDNATGEFTWVPDSADCKITVHSVDA